MKNSARILFCGAICLAACAAAYAGNDEAEARRIAESAIKTGAIDYLTDRDFLLDGSKIKATARAIDPKQNVKTEIKELKLLPDSVTLKFKVDAPFRFEGKLINDDKEQDIRGKANIGQLVSIEAKYWFDDRGLQVDAKATDMEFSGKVEELMPEDGGGGKSAAGKILIKQLNRQKDDLLRDFNQWQQEYQRKNR
jgi:hypothetical protein